MPRGGMQEAHTHPGAAFVGMPVADILQRNSGGGSLVGQAERADLAAGLWVSAILTTKRDQAAEIWELPAAEVRYVDGADKDIGYKTRAFLLDVVIRDERLPDLLAKLTNSDFPVEIVRVEITSSYFDRKWWWRWNDVRHECR